MFAGVPASLSAFAVAFAGVPASLSAFAVAFAGVPQVSRHLPWRLREFPQVSRHLPRGVCGHRRIWPGASADAGQVCRVLEGPPAGRVGAYCIRPTKRPGTGRMIISGVHPFGPVGPFGVGLLGAAPRWFVGAGTRVGGATAYAPPGATIGGEYTSPGYGHSALAGCLGGVFDTPLHRVRASVRASLRSFGPVARLGGVCNTPLPWYVHSPRRGGCPASFAGVRRRPRPNSPASVDAPRQRPSADAPRQRPF